MPRSCGEASRSGPARARDFRWQDFRCRVTRDGAARRTATIFPAGNARKRARIQRLNDGALVIRVRSVTNESVATFLTHRDAPASDRLAPPTRPISREFSQFSPKNETHAVV